MNHYANAKNSLNFASRTGPLECVRTRGVPLRNPLFVGDLHIVGATRRDRLRRSADLRRSATAASCGTSIRYGKTDAPWLYTENHAGVQADGVSFEFWVLAPETDAGASTVWRVIGSAVLVNLLNPKLTILFFVFLPMFVNPASDGAVSRMVVLALVFMAITLVIFGVLAGGWGPYPITRPGAPAAWRSADRGWTAIPTAFARSARAASSTLSASSTTRWSPAAIPVMRHPGSVTRIVGPPCARSSRDPPPGPLHLG
ncbi:LysE family translocator [Microbacterium sp.]|uniref:LysE family translocator n=1 Tax=Microbacterium sp. TaxID=51671 RepID=UPI0039E6C7A6